jgi:anti-sigma-K factor RskA
MEFPDNLIMIMLSMGDTIRDPSVSRRVRALNQFSATQRMQLGAWTLIGGGDPVALGARTHGRAAAAWPPAHGALR